MSEKNEEDIHIKSRLLYLYDLTSQDYPDWDGKRVKEFIDMDEWDLAADSLAYCYLPGNYEINETIFNIFVDLAKRMDLLDGELPSIRKLTAQKPSFMPESS